MDIDIATLFSVIAVGIILLTWFFRAEWDERRAKATSAQLCMQLLEDWNNNNTFAKMMSKLKKPNAEFADKDDNVHFVLGKFENLAILKKDKILNETHVRKFFGKDIVSIAVNESVTKILYKYHYEDVKHNYNNLIVLRKDSEKWGIPPYSSREQSSDALGGIMNR